MTDIWQTVASGRNADRDQMEEAIGAMMRGEIAEQRIGDFLLALREKGVTVDELAGAASALRKHMVRLETDRRPLVDTCGTGGDRSGTFNISTAAAVVTAAAGVAVAKHGNRGISSKSGSADVLAELGVDIEGDVAAAGRCLEGLGICFCFAPLLHPAMKHVAPIRRRLGVPTIFNMLGPLANPAGAPFQLLGVGRPEIRLTMARTLAELGTERTLVVSGQDGLDEISLAAPTDVALVAQGAVEEFVWSPADFGLPTAGHATLIVDGPAGSARVIREVLAGQPGPARDIVVLNAAAALWIAGRERTLIAAAQLAADTIDQGTAAQLLQAWTEFGG